VSIDLLQRSTLGNLIRTVYVKERQASAEEMAMDDSQCKRSSEQAVEAPRSDSRRELLTRLLAIAVVLVITLAVWRMGDKLERFKLWGYPGVFVVSFLGNATVILPAPSLALVFAMGSVLNPLLVGLVAGPAEALGELTGYLAGYSGRAIVKDRRTYERLEGWMQRNGALTIFVLSIIPNPFFDLAGIAAGVLRYPISRFLLFCWLGKSIKTIAFAFAGAYSLTFFERFL
jgi:membrane protein DedA with SNARE-associated domain